MPRDFSTAAGNGTGENELGKRARSCRGEGCRLGRWRCLNVPLLHPLEEDQEAPELVAGIYLARGVTLREVVNDAGAENISVIAEALAEGFFEHGAEGAAEPIVGGNVETDFAVFEDSGREFVLHQFAEHGFLFCALNLEAYRERGCKFHQARM